jgi:hypothetical protein
MIEIRELVIRANVNGSDRGGRERPSPGDSERNNQGGCEENIDLMLKIIKEKKER